MEHIGEQDLIKLRELLRRTGEFIAYFELAEAKMLEWRQDMETRAANQQQQFQQQVHTLQTELNAFQETLSQAGLARLRLLMEQTLTLGEERMHSMQKIEEDFLQKIAAAHMAFIQHSKQMAEQINAHTDNALERIDTQLAHYDVQHFYRIANESCEQVDRAAQNAIIKSGRLLHRFQWRTIFLAFLTTIVSSFFISLYINDEYPWEIHQNAMNERNAGRMLINAWSKLSYQERTKILGEQAYQKS
ncbi:MULTISPECIES: hypothetical protein [Legionella]|uniref:Uncharacterized protein n=1 Tax=Legionella septentrionalis TaxID=2498109 RepID=A0A433JM94_9GAMM|nr:MULTISPECIES: hypothetical protein [Legionella]MCP0914765.1 hypothetical protein [Legionella sp. 27cVA30]RUQ91095.1 hypothetical protein EKM59_01050 [Legionella septentrionalis]RUR02836.1 hypothetical protein ELY11_00295 [Legionella septentrionalis]RUR11434.1 hypothetical protein ELY14_01405 [Legionella septentrionalis]